MTSTPPVGRFRVLLSHVWRRKWLVVVPLLVSAVTSWLVLRFVPVQYQSSVTLVVVPQQVPVEYVKQVQTESIGERLQAMGAQVLSRTRLERIIEKYNLYPDERRKGIMEDVVRQMRDDIETISESTVNAPGTTIRVSYRSTNPRLAQQITSELASFFITTNVADGVSLSEGTLQFLDAMVEDTKRQLGAYETAHGHPTRGESRVIAIEREVLENDYRSLLVKRQEARIALNLQNRQYGEQMRVLGPPRYPERPIGLTRTELWVVSTLAGLALGIAIVGVSRTRS